MIRDNAITKWVMHSGLFFALRCHSYKVEISNEAKLEAVPVTLLLEPDVHGDIDPAGPIAHTAELILQ